VDLKQTFVLANEFKEGDRSVGGTADPLIRDEARRSIEALRLGDITGDGFVGDGVSDALERSLDRVVLAGISAFTIGRIKQMLLKIGWPAEDLAGYVDGEAHPISLRQDGWHLRDYQQMATDSFWEGGSGVVVLPCGAGKTLVGAAAMAKAGATTLILVTNTVAGRQWKRELMNRTSLTENEIGEYSGEKKEILGRRLDGCNERLRNAFGASRKLLLRKPEIHLNGPVVPRSVCHEYLPYL
jgi:hypothetical protein